MKEENINDQAYTNRELYLIIKSNHEEVMREVGFIKEQTTKSVEISS